VGSKSFHIIFLLHSLNLETMISNVHYDIFKAIQDFYSREINVHHRIHAMCKVTCILVNLTLLIGVNAVIKLFKEVNIRKLESPNPYKNLLFSCHLVMKKDDVCEDWLTLKFSSFKNSGMGVFASWVSRIMNL
jgi:hypothetical protein